MMRGVIVTQCADRALHALLYVLLNLPLAGYVNNSISLTIIFMKNAYSENLLEK
jgi:hypothetical protein